MAGRTENVKRNATWSMVNRVVTILTPFITKTALIYTLGIEYVGLNSLFISLLSMLSLAELGVGSALVYMMYRPIAEGDDDAVCALLSLYRKWYRNIGLGILVAGLLCLPALPYLIAGDVPDDVSLYALYLIYLVNTALTYFLFAYKTSAFNAAQRTDYVSKVGAALSVISCALQIALLLLLKSYYAYAIVLPIITLLNNLTISALFKKKFPSWSCRGEVPKEDVAAIKENIKGLVTIKVSNVVVGSVGSVVVSAFFGLAMLGTYNNYASILNVAFGITAVIRSSLIPSVGNSIVTEDAKKLYADFRKFDFIYAWIAAWFSACILALAQPFIEVWIGDEYLMPIHIVALFALQFYAGRMLDMTYVYRDAAGLWAKGRWVPLIAAGVVTVGSVSLSQLLGIEGVLISVIVVFVFIYMLFYTRVLFSDLFRELSSWRQYLTRQMVRIVVFVLVALATYLLSTFIPGYGLLRLMLIAIECVVVPNALLYLAWGRSEDFKSAKSFLLRALGISRH